MLRILLWSSIFILFAQAHKLNVFTQTNNNQVFIHAYFANGKGCQQCEVILEDSHKVFSIKSQTNENGEVNLFVDKGEYTLKVDARSGHEFIESIIVTSKQNTSANQDATLLLENKNLKNKIASLEKQLQWMNILKTLLAIAAIIVIFGFLKRIKQ